MVTRVELINNPYKQQLRILMNGEAVSVYSNLEKFMDEPFSYWCDRILEAVYEECNGGSFSLHFCSRGEELRVMEKLARACPHCVQYSSSPLTRPATLLDRIKGLNQLVRGVRESGYRRFRKRILFVIPDTLRRLEKDLAELEVRNSFCQVESGVLYYQDYGRKKTEADLVILISDQPGILQLARRMNLEQGFGIALGGGSGFQEKAGGLFLYESREQELFETIFECLLLSPLLEMFRACIDTMSAEVKSQHGEELEELLSIELKILPQPESTTIEAGRSSRIRFRTDMEGYEAKSVQFHFSYSEKGIIRCNGLLVEGLKPGKATLYIYKEGEQSPCASVAYSVIQRNRIEELRLEEDSLVIGEGDFVRLSVSYLPVDADNADTIEWSSDQESVAKVDGSGGVRGIARGSCTIRCFAEQVSASCRCTVKPHLQTISVEEQELEMIYGQERELKINLKPENCIDDKIVVSSMNMQIVNVVGRTLKAIGTGQTRIVIQNSQETVRREIAVTVLTEKEYKNRQKQKEKAAGNQAGKKKGLLSKLFG